MDRRRFLSSAGVGFTALFAGCSGDGQEIEDEQATSTPEPAGDDGSGGESTPDATESETPTETDTPEGEPDLSLASHELVIEEGEFSDDIYVAATVENTGSAPSGDIELAVNWYNSDGDLVDDSTERLATLREGTTWLARVSAISLEADEVDDYEIEGEFTEELPSPPLGAQVIESDHNVTPDGEVTVSGRVENTADEEIGYLEGIGQLLDSDGNVLADNWTNEDGIPPGETWRFEVEWFQFGRAEEVADHGVHVDGNAF